MRLFECQCCAQALFFENEKCEKCGRRLGYMARENRLIALEPAANAWREAGVESPFYSFCANAEHGVCNWLVAATRDHEVAFCEACRHNHMIPDLSRPTNLERWRAVEFAKHRLIYTLMRLDLQRPARGEAEEGLQFDFLDEDMTPKVMTGHADGLITINLAEAGDDIREKRRGEMGEAYRTLLGHLRHEIGHYYWDLLVRDQPALEGYRNLFGDERADYAAALQAHYTDGAPPDWVEHFVSAYASAHPWEDFAETFAHYLHIVDTLETAKAFGLTVHPHIAVGDELSADVSFDPYGAASIRTLIDAWLPLCFAVNSLNRSMGQPDLYPFVLSPAAIDKLDFVRRLLHPSGGNGGTIFV
ncbi:MAG TPA: putative zinc-binding metallopeptidase [Beijerinckiaceae bacterium]|nr:putative zinc-binding metallopeptidase [Beijerinckiaceae bacterium]